MICTSPTCPGRSTCGGCQFDHYDDPHLPDEPLWMQLELSVDGLVDWRGALAIQIGVGPVAVVVPLVGRTWEELAAAALCAEPDVTADDLAETAEAIRRKAGYLFGKRATLPTYDSDWPEDTGDLPW